NTWAGGRLRRRDARPERARRRDDRRSARHRPHSSSQFAGPHSVMRPKVPGARSQPRPVRCRVHVQSSNLWHSALAMQFVQSSLQFFARQVAQASLRMAHEPPLAPPVPPPSLPPVPPPSLPPVPPPSLPPVPP